MRPLLLALALAAVVSGSYQRGVVARWPLNVIVMPAAYPDVLAAIQNRVVYDEGLLSYRGVSFGATNDEPSFYISRVPGSSRESESLQRFMQSCAFLCYVYADAVQGITIHDALPPLAASQASIPTHYAVEMGVPQGGGAHNCSCLTNDGQDPATWSGIPASSQYGVGYSTARVGTHGVASLYTGGYTDGLVPLTDCSAEGTMWAPAPWATMFYQLAYHGFSSSDSLMYTENDATLWRWYNRTVHDIGWSPAPSTTIPPTPSGLSSGTRLEWARFTTPNVVPGSCLCFPGYVDHTCSDHFPECAVRSMLPGGADARQASIYAFGSITISGDGVPAWEHGWHDDVSDWSRLSAVQAGGLRCDYGGCKDSRGGVRCQLEPCGLAPHGWNVSWCGAGVCAPESGRCLCDPGWDPDTDCSTCLPSHYQDGLGACVTWRGVCVDPQGNDPGSAVRGYLHPPECSGHGTCSLRFGVSVVLGQPPPTGSAACVCSEGWAGRFCQQSTTSDDCGLAGTRQCRGLLQRHDVVDTDASGCDRRLVSVPTTLRLSQPIEAAAVCASLTGVLASPEEVHAHQPWGPVLGWVRDVAVDGVPTWIGTGPPYVSRPYEVAIRADTDSIPLFVYCMVSPCGDGATAVLVTSITAVVHVDVSDLVLDVAGHVGLSAAVASGALSACSSAIPGATPASASVDVGRTVASALVWDSQRRGVPFADAVGVPVTPAVWAAARAASNGTSYVSTLTPGSVTHRRWTYAEAYEEAYTDIWVPYFSLKHPSTVTIGDYVPIAVDSVVIHPVNGRVSSFGVDGVHVPNWVPYLPHLDVPDVVVRPGRVWTTCSVPAMTLDELYRLSRELEGVAAFAPHGARAQKSR